MDHYSIPREDESITIATVLPPRASQRKDALYARILSILVIIGLATICAIHVSNAATKVTLNSGTGSLMDNVVNHTSYYVASNDPWASPVTNNFTGYAKDGQYYNAGTPTGGQASWFTEGANSFRGGSASFPDRALIVATNTGVSIIDANTNGMWMRFRSTTAGDFLEPDTAGGNYVSASMANGILYIAYDNGNNGALLRVDFTNDQLWRIIGSQPELNSENIAGRHNGGTFSDNNGIQGIIGTNVFDTSAATIQGETFAAIGTNDGVILIDEADNSRVQYAGTTSGREMDHVYLTSGGNLYFARYDDGSLGFHSIVAFYDVHQEVENQDWQNDADALYGTNFLVSDVAIATGHTITDLYVTERTSRAALGDNTIYVGTTEGASIIQENQADYTKGIVTNYQSSLSTSGKTSEKILSGSTDEIGGISATPAGNIGIISTKENNTNGAVSLVDLTTNELLTGLDTPTLTSDRNIAVSSLGTYGDFALGSLLGLDIVNEVMTPSTENDEKLNADKGSIKLSNPTPQQTTEMLFGFNPLSTEAIDTVEIVFHSTSDNPPSTANYSFGGTETLVEQHIWGSPTGTTSIASVGDTITITRTSGAETPNGGIANVRVGGISNTSVAGTYYATIIASNGPTIVSEEIIGFTLTNAIDLDATLTTNNSSISFVLNDDGTKDNPNDNIGDATLTLGTIDTTIESDEVTGQGVDGLNLSITNTYPGYEVFISDSANGFANRIATSGERSVNDSTAPTNNAFHDYSGNSLPGNNIEAYFYSVSGPKVDGGLQNYNAFSATQTRIIQNADATENEEHIISVYAQKHTDTVGGDYEDEITYTFSPLF